MSDNINNQQPENTEEFSSIFSDPAAHKEVRLKKKRLLPKIIASVLCLAILIGGTVAVVKLIPVLEDESSSVPETEQITVKEVDGADVSTVKAQNSKTAAEFYSKTVKEDDTETTEWYLKGIGKDLTDSSAISSVVDSVTTITATRKITEKTAKECGLVNTKTKATVALKKGKGYTVLVGAKSPDNSGYYLQIEGEKDIYLVPDSLYEALQFEALDFADNSTISGFENDESGKYDDYFDENGTLAKFDTITLKGEKHPQGLVLSYNTDEQLSAYMGYIVTHPVNRIGENGEATLALFQNGVTVSGAYSYSVAPSELKRFGLDNPTLTATLKIKSKALTYKFAIQKDGSYAAVSNESKLIKKVDAETLKGVIDLSTTDYYSAWIFYTSIDDISAYTLKTADKTLKFGVKQNEVEEDSDEDDYTITVGGKKVDAESFQNLYQYAISIKCRDYTVDEVSSSPEVTLELTLKKGGSVKVCFYRFNDTKYQCTTDGKVLGKVSISAVEKLIKNAEKVAKGTVIGEIN